MFFSISGIQKSLDFSSFASTIIRFSILSWKGPHVLSPSPLTFRSELYSLLVQLCGILYLFGHTFFINLNFHFMLIYSVVVTGFPILQFAYRHFLLKFESQTVSKLSMHVNVWESPQCWLIVHIVLVLCHYLWT